MYNIYIMLGNVQTAMCVHVSVYVYVDRNNVHDGITYIRHDVISSYQEMR